MCRSQLRSALSRRWGARQAGGYLNAAFGWKRKEVVQLTPEALEVPREPGAVFLVCASAVCRLDSNATVKIEGLQVLSTYVAGLRLG